MVNQYLLRLDLTTPVGICSRRCPRLGLGAVLTDVLGSGDCYSTTVRVPDVLALAETGVIVHLFHSSPAPKLWSKEVFAFLLTLHQYLHFCTVHCFSWSQAPLSSSAQLIIFVHSRACWVTFIATSASLYSHIELYEPHTLIG